MSEKIIQTMLRSISHERVEHVGEVVVIGLGRFGSSVPWPAKKSRTTSSGSLPAMPNGPDAAIAAWAIASADVPGGIAASMWHNPS